ncbi:MAG TPA: WYL domain-containing protein, partial [Microbacterium sp.]|nr:WYL domain-containing protein [Microbacterium sp.]
HAGEQAPDWFDTDAGAVVARIRFAEDVAPLLGDYLDRATLETADGVTVATMRVADELSLRRLAARRGGLVEVLEPAAARRAVADWAEAGLAQYR